MVFIILGVLIVSLLGATGCIDESPGQGWSPPSTNPPAQVPRTTVQGTSPPGTFSGEQQALLNAAWVRNAEGRFSEANAYTDQVLAEDPGNLRALSLKGWALTGLGQYQEAVQVLATLMARDEGSSIDWSNRGFALYHLGRCQEAVYSFDRAAELDPTDYGITKYRKMALERCSASGASQQTTAPRTTTPVPTTVTQVPRTTVPYTSIIRTTAPYSTIPPTLAATAVPAVPSYDDLVNSLGTTWIVKEYGPMGNFDGVWTRRPGTDIFDASWSGGAVKDVIEVIAVSQDEVTLYRQGNKGYYYGEIAIDGRSISGTGSWYTPGQTWTVTIGGAAL